LGSKTQFASAELVVTKQNAFNLSYADIQRVKLGHILASRLSHFLAPSSIIRQRREVHLELFEVFAQQARSSLSDDQVCGIGFHGDDGSAARLRFQNRNPGPVKEVWVGE
jgi:hypothetical protein